LGSSGTASETVPKEIPGSFGVVKELEAGDTHSMFIDDSNKGYVFGENSDGRLGMGTLKDELSAKQVPDLFGIKFVAAGKHSLFSDGLKVYSSGAPSASLGYRNYTTFSPSLVISDFTSISTGENHALYIDTSQKVYSSGNNDFGQLCLGNLLSQQTPTLSTLTSIIQVSAGHKHSLFLTNSNKVSACGSQEHGRLGNGATTDFKSTAISITGFSNVVKVAAGYDFSLMLTSLGTVYGFGNNQYGQLGVGISAAQVTAIIVPSLSGITDIQAGRHHTLALGPSQRVYEQF
jgi:alpha-tubulin suppressor-like RCC1 family protein